MDYLDLTIEDETKNNLKSLHSKKTLNFKLEEKIETEFVDLFDKILKNKSTTPKSNVQIESSIVLDLNNVDVISSSSNINVVEVNMEDEEKKRKMKKKKLLNMR